MKKYAVAAVAALAVLAPAAPAEAALSEQDVKAKAAALDGKSVIQKYKRKHDGEVPSMKRGTRLLDKQRTGKHIFRMYLPASAKHYCIAAGHMKASEDGKPWVWFYDSKRKETFRAWRIQGLEKRPGACLKAIATIEPEEPQEPDVVG